MAKQVETVERQHECTEPRTMIVSTINITQHLEPYIDVCVNMDHLRQTNVQGRPHTVRTPDVEEHILRGNEKNPGTSSRQVARQHGISQRTVICILHDNSYYPYHLQRVQGL